MDSVQYLVVGAGISGLSFANSIREKEAGAEVLVIEADAEPGGYCKTIKQDGFVWDYSGHFFHFRHPEIEAWLRDRMPGQDVRTVEKRSLIRFKGQDIDFPFQKNIHQLDKADFIDCLVSLYFRDEETSSAAAGSFKEMLYQRFGQGIAERFLIPYNEKLYACDLDHLDRDAMGRFFPHADIADIIRNMRDADNTSYNSSFTYPRGGAIEYVNALLRDLPDETLSYSERLVSVDLEGRIAETTDRQIRFEHLVSSAPLPALLAMCGHDVAPAVFSWNKVLVFNLGFDRKGPRDVHWTYFPERELCFYRVGFYDNIMDSDRMSLYVEIGAARDSDVSVAGLREQVLADLTNQKIITDHELVSWHSVVMDPAYVHITRDSITAVDSARQALSQHGVHSVGRYGGWTYCSIEDNIVETRALATELAS